MIKFKDAQWSTGKKLKYTTISSLTFQLATLVSGFILPAIRLKYYGTEVNGLVASITQFLALISFLDMGVGAVIQANLYTPLAKRDYSLVSDILISGRNFFRLLAKIFVVYTIALAVFYPILTNQSFGFWYVSLLIIIISVDSFCQYYFGLSYQLLFTSDQRGYIQYTIKIVTQVMNLVLSVLLITFGFSIHIVKLMTTIVFLLRPLCMYIYFKKMYPAITLNKKLDYEPVNQKWNGFAQHVASVVLDNTDIVILTMFSTLGNVSVYSIYNMVILGVKQLFTSLTQGIQPLLGEYWARHEIEKLNKLFGYVEWIIHIGTVVIFGCTAILIIPFIRVYTSSITDYNYIAVTFGVLLTVAHAYHCIRLPYNLMILAGGHFKQTQICYVFAACINLIISVFAVKRFGLVGVTIGTLVAMIYQTIWLVIYLSKNLIKWPIIRFVKQVVIDVLIVMIASSACNSLLIDAHNYFEWFVWAIVVAFIWLLSAVVICMIFNREYLKTILGVLKNKVSKKE